MYLGSKPRRRSLRLIIILLLLILVVVLFVYYISNREPNWSQPFDPAPTPTRTSQSFAVEGEAFYGEGQLDKAILAYQEAVAISPDNTLAHTRLSNFLILHQRTAESLLHAQEAVKLEPSNSQTVAMFCRALDWEGEYGRALDACECAIEMDPEYAEAYAYLAEVYADTGNWYAARDYAQQAVDLDFQSLDAHRNQGYVFEMQGRFSQAVASYENAIFLHPNLAPLYLSAGRIYRAMGKFTEAVDRIEKISRLEPDNPLGYDQLGWTYYAAGDYSRAADYLEQATLVDPDYASAWGHMGIVNYVLQQYEAAIGDFQRAIELAEKDHLRRARQIVISSQDTGYDPPQQVDLMQADLYPLDRTGVEELEGELSPILLERKALGEPNQTCGDLIASDLRAGSEQPELPDTPEPGVTETPQPGDPLVDARGKVIFDLDSGRIVITLTDMPQPEDVPYEVRLTMWPGDTVSLGYFQPDPQGNASLEFVVDFEDVHPAPVEYYYSLGFAYVHLDQCKKGVPWLLKSLEIDSSAANPAWQGLAECNEISREELPAGVLQDEEEGESQGQPTAESEEESENTPEVQPQPEGENTPEAQ